MNLNYISGFFDADGSITIAKERKEHPFRGQVKIDFTNTELELLHDIQHYLMSEYGIKGYISTKPPRKGNHKTGYSLSYSYRNAYQLCQLLSSKHPKKAWRIRCVLKFFRGVTKRNGKYSERELIRKYAFDRLFYWL